MAEAAVARAAAEMAGRAAARIFGLGAQGRRREGVRRRTQESGGWTASVLEDAKK